MSEARHVEQKRTHSFILKLTEEEHAALIRLAAANYRRPGDQLRALLAAALTEGRRTEDS
jgi:hypothetical protein